MILFRELFAPRSLIKIGLLLLAVNALATGLGNSITDMSHAAFFPVAIFAVLFAWLLAFSKSSAPRIWTAIVILGLLFVFLQAGRLWQELGFFIRDIANLQIGFVRWVFGNPAPDLLPLGVSFSRIMTQSWGVVEKLVFAIQARSLADATVRELLWDIPILVSSAWAAWTLRRRKNALFALAPVISTLGYALYFSGERPFPLQVTIAVLLLLMGMGEWEKNLPRLPDSFSMRKAASDANLTIVIISLAMALGAGWTPSFSLKKTADQIIRFNREAKNREIADALGLEEDPNSTRRFITPGLPRQHLIGAQPSTSQTIRFIVTTGELPPMPNNEFEETIPRYYWRGVTYDIYNGQGWATTLVRSMDYPANQLLFDPGLEGYRVLNLDIRKTSNIGSQVYWSGTLMSVAQPFELGWRSLPGSIPETDDPFSGGDVLGAAADAAHYQVISLLPTATIEQLRASSQVYPENISKRYLALPKSVPERVRALALNLTSDGTNPFDKAQAIEAYLRTYPYSLEVPPPPQGREISDYFLFDLGTGYCDYYATSMVVMARAAGLPARLVTGYSSGSYIPSSAEYVVRAANAHSWPEIYFSGIGWVEFEPTASQPEIARPLEAQDTAHEPIVIPTQTAGGEGNNSTGIQALTRILPIAGILLIAVTGAGLALYLMWFRAFANADIRQIYIRVFQQGNKIAPSPAINETPSMFAERIGDHLGRIPRNGFAGQALGPAGEELDYLTGLYIRSMYSSRAATNEEEAQARTTWQRLFWRLLLARILKGKSAS